MTPPDLMRIEHASVQARIRRYRRTVLVSFDASMVVFAYGLVALLRYTGVADVPWGGVALLAAITVAVQLTLGALAKVYRGRTLIASADDTLRLAGMVLLSSATAQLVNLLAPEQLASRALPFGAAAIAVALMVLVRAVWRTYTQMVRAVMAADSQRTLVIGAGEAGQQLVASMRRTPDSPFQPVALLDDDPWKRHLRIDGVPVMGRLADLEDVLARTEASQVVVAVPSASSQVLGEISDRARALGVDVKVLPPVAGLLGERADIRDIRDINVGDLLGRGAIETDIEAIAGFIAGKRVLVTGAGGSIGSELCRQIAKWQPGELMMLDRDESGLHGVQLSITGQAMLDSEDVILADIRDLSALTHIFEARRPEVVFHAAALKHLPMLEQYPDEAVKTNVLGTANVLEVCDRFEVERVVNISTDKAADPTSALGFSKRVAERLTADSARQRHGAWMSVRFGNVLGSRGSVLTTFAAQIAAGGPITVTHPDVTRYFMTVPEAVQLVLQAGAIGRDGEVLILDMGQPVRIDDVARKLIEQSGRDIEIVYTGLREGEKLDEILISGSEADARPVHPLITHVQVEPLPASAVHHALLTSDLPAQVLLRAWCAAPPASDGAADLPVFSERLPVGSARHGRSEGS